MQTLHVNPKKSQVRFIFLSVFAHKLLFGFLEADAFLLLLAFSVCKVKQEDILPNHVSSMKTTLTQNNVHVMC